VLQVMSVSLTTTTLVAATPPNVTAVAPVKPVPPMVTAVAVFGSPWFGVMLLMFGAAISASDIAAGAAGSWSLRAVVVVHTSPGTAGTASRSSRCPERGFRSPTATKAEATGSGPATMAARCWPANCTAGQGSAIPG
jgi:hypothetical protein